MALVHNGIIENHDELRQSLQAKGYQFDSQTDTEVMVHLIDSLYAGDLLGAVMQAVKQLHGAFAIAVMARDEPHRVVGARAGSPLVLGIGQGELFLASDAMALVGVTDQVVYLAEGDVADTRKRSGWEPARPPQHRPGDQKRENDTRTRGTRPAFRSEAKANAAREQQRQHEREDKADGEFHADSSRRPAAACHASRTALALLGDVRRGHRTADVVPAAADIVQKRGDLFVLQ